MSIFEQFKTENWNGRGSVPIIPEVEQKAISIHEAILNGALSSLVEEPITESWGFKPNALHYGQAELFYINEDKSKIVVLRVEHDLTVNIIYKSPSLKLEGNNDFFDKLMHMAS